MSNTQPLKTLGIIVIATGKYFEEFIPNLKTSLDQYFIFSDYQVQLYCFTDANVQIAGVKNIPCHHYAWPFSTLLRYRWIAQHLAEFEKHDFLLYMDADMRVVATPPRKIFDKALIAVLHPGYVKKPGAFEIDRADSCYVPPPLRRHYYQGCFWGGQSFAFSRMIYSLARKVDEDLSLGQIPIWHDESYLNKYLSTQACEALPPTFAWPEGQTPVRPPYILHLEKKHQVIRQASEQKLDIDAFITNRDSEAELEIYKKLYLNAHEKCQRLEEHLAQRHIWLVRLREWLSHYRHSKNKH